MKEKKILWNLVVIISLFLCGGGISNAAVSGVCSNCHTMHNSQSGIVMGLDNPQSALLLNDCLGCHTSASNDPFVDGYPFVKLASGASDSNCLAGGFFQLIAVTTDNHKNQNHDIGATADPAGYNSDENAWYTGGTDGDSNGLGCAGTNGCHGNQTDLDDMAAISGGHHNPDAYRILFVGDNPVVGSGAKDYEEAIISNPAIAVDTSGDTTQNVNIYSAGELDPSISELCAKCHGDFHNESGSIADVGGGSSPWIRHPTDVNIPLEWAIQDGYTLNGDDYKNHPVGWDNAIYNTENKRVTCLSCHRAHGTENNDLLRWAYSTQEAGGGEDYGCLGCHNNQR